MARFLDLSGVRPLSNEGLADFAQNLQKGMQAGAMPEQLRRQAEKERLANALMQIQQKYLPQIYESDIAFKGAQSDLAGQEAEAFRRFGGKPTPAMIEVSQVYDPGTPKFNQALALKQGFAEVRPRPDGVPEDAIMFSEFESKNAVLDQQKRMREDVRRSENMMKAYDTVNEMQKLVEQHPDMADYFQSIIIDPTDKGFIGKTLRFLSSRLVGKDKLAAIEKMQKLSQDLVIKAGEGLGAKNFTDMKARMIDISKPGFTNTAESNQFILEKLKNEFQPWGAYKQDLLNGLRKGYSVEYDLDKYRTKPYQTDPSLIQVPMNDPTMDSPGLESLSDDELMALWGQS